MLQDGALPSRKAAARRQDTGAGTLSTSTISGSTTVATLLTDTTPAPQSTPLSLVSHAAVSTITDGSEPEIAGKICTVPLPSGGLITFNETYSLLLEENVSFAASCANHSIFSGNETDMSNTTVIASNDPFYSSVSPQIYALATATSISYILLILIFITPRTFYVGGPGGGSGAMGSGGGLRTLLPGTGGRNSGVIGIGRRPLLQKIAAFTVVLSLTIATEKTFQVAAQQYHSGYVEAKSLVQDVVNSLELRIIRVISDTFLWLAQVQTLIRLFPRHKEKVTIKWLGFAMVLCDTVFSILENVSQVADGRPVRFTDAIPALSYLFELAIGLIYASCVLYYSLSKRRFAFWHAKMRNVCLVAILSLVAVTIPVAFFIIDVAQPDIATWGEYIRWVGAAAASVVVWEWVERIEALERDEKKDGILGREIFDGDEMLDLTPSDDDYASDRPSRSNQPRNKGGSSMWKKMRDLNIDMPTKIPLKKWKRGRQRPSNKEKTTSEVTDQAIAMGSNQISRPLQAMTPISRSDTNSAASTVYAVRYHDPFSPSPAIPEDAAVETVQPRSQPDSSKTISEETTLTNSTSMTMDTAKDPHVESIPVVPAGRQMWQAVSHPFKRKRAEPPAEVAAQIAESNARRSPIDAHRNLKSRLAAFTVAQKGKFRHSNKSRTPLAVTVIPARPRGPERSGSSSPVPEGTPETQDEESDSTESDHGRPDPTSLPVTVIPAPVRGGRTWSPDDLVDEPDRVSTPINVRDHESPNPTAVSRRPGTSSTPVSNSQSPPAVVASAIQTQRGALTISESPLSRSRNSNNPATSAGNGVPSTSPTPVMLRRPRSTRSGTIQSINDRLETMGSSPGPAPGFGTGPSRSGTADSTATGAGPRSTPGVYQPPARSGTASTNTTADDARQSQGHGGRTSV